MTSQGFPIATIVSPGNEHDSKRFVEVMEKIRIKNERRPKTRPLEVLADSAYDNVAIRKYLRARGN